MKRTILILLLGVSALILAACGNAAAASSKAEFTIEMTEFGYSPDTIEVSVGQEVTLHIVNLGALEHEVMIGREVVMEEGRSTSYTHNIFEDTPPMVMAADKHDDGNQHAADDHAADKHGGGGHGFMVSLPGGDADKITTLTFTVTEGMVGEWEIGCFIATGSHYEAGMVGKFIVNP